MREMRLLTHKPTGQVKHKTIERCPAQHRDILDEGYPTEYYSDLLRCARTILTAPEVMRLAFFNQFIAKLSRDYGVPAATAESDLAAVYWSMFGES